MAANTPSQDAPYLVVGLGNPGPRYARTRHNAGFMVVDELARKYGLRFAKGQGNSEVARGTIAGTPVILAKPLTFMNDSGMAVGVVSRFYRVPIARILVVYDEIALPLGTLRIREKGSSAGHNGIKSIIHHLGTQNFARMRVGVDQPSPGRHSQIDWVLGRFSSDEQKVMDETISRAIEAIEAVLTIGIERAMNQYNAKENNVPTSTSKASKPLAGGQVSGAGGRASGSNDQKTGIAAEESQSVVPVELSAPQNKPDSWVDRARRIIRGDHSTTETASHEQNPPTPDP